MKFDELIQLSLHRKDTRSQTESEEMAAAILFELKRQESETNSNYAAAYMAIVELLGDQMPDFFAEWFTEIMNDENDHAAKFNKMASELIGVKVGRATS